MRCAGTNQKAPSGAVAPCDEPHPDRAQGAGFAGQQISSRYSDWQPAETAPRDGTRIIGWYGDKPIIVWWRSGRSTKRYEGGVTVWFWSSGYFRHGEPGCWQPVPDAPEGGVAALTDGPAGSGHERVSAAEGGLHRTHSEGDR
jgi:hypothetical protein